MTAIFRSQHNLLSLHIEELQIASIQCLYPHSGGGGISEIKQTQTNVYVVSIAQEERIDQLTYELSIDDTCKVVLVKKEETTINFSR